MIYVSGRIPVEFFSYFLTAICIYVTIQGLSIDLLFQYDFFLTKLKEQTLEQISLRSIFQWS
jgi:hypothetical protein